MEYFNLVLQAFQAALGWFGLVITADAWLFSAFLGLIFVSMVVRLFLRPFMQGMVEGAGSDYATQKRRDAAEKVKPSKSTGMSVASDWY